MTMCSIGSVTEYCIKCVVMQYRVVIFAASPHGSYGGKSVVLWLIALKTWGNG